MSQSRKSRKQSKSLSRKQSRKQSRKNRKSRGGCGCNASRKLGGKLIGAIAHHSVHHGGAKLGEAKLGGAGAAEFAQAVYGSPQHAISAQDNTIAMNPMQGGAGAAEYAQAVYGTPQHAVSANSNVIAMNPVTGGALVGGSALSPANVSASSSGLSDQASNVLAAASAHGATDMMNMTGGSDSREMPMEDKKGGDIIVPALLLATNEAYKRGFGKKTMGALTRTLKNVTTSVKANVKANARSVGSRFSRRK